MQIENGRFIPKTGRSNPNPLPGTNNQYTLDGRYSDCSNVAAPGVLPIRRYLISLPYAAPANCAPGRYYMLNNTNPGFLPNGQIPLRNRSLPAAPIGAF